MDNELYYTSLSKSATINNVPERSISRQITNSIFYDEMDFNNTLNDLNNDLEISNLNFQCAQHLIDQIYATFSTIAFIPIEDIVQKVILVKIAITNNNSAYSKLLNNFTVVSVNKNSWIDLIILSFVFEVKLVFKDWFSELNCSFFNKGMNNFIYISITKSNIAHLKTIQIKLTNDINHVTFNVIDTFKNNLLNKKIVPFYFVGKEVLIAQLIYKDYIKFSNKLFELNQSFFNVQDNEINTNESLSDVNFTKMNSFGFEKWYDLDTVYGCIDNNLLHLAVRKDIEINFNIERHQNQTKILNKYYYVFKDGCGMVPLKEENISRLGSLKLSFGTIPIYLFSLNDINKTTWKKIIIMFMSNTIKYFLESKNNEIEFMNMKDTVQFTNIENTTSLNCCIYNKYIKEWILYVKTVMQKENNIETSFYIEKFGLKNEINSKNYFDLYNLIVENFGLNWFPNIYYDICMNVTRTDDSNPSMFYCSFNKNTTFPKSSTLR